MKLNIAIASAILALVGAASANAQDFSVALTPTSPVTYTGTPVVFGGTITNTTGGSLLLDGDSLTDGGFPSFLSDQLAGNLPVTLAAGASYTSGDLFTVTPNAPFSSVAGTLGVSGGINEGSTGSADWQVVNGTPEPGSLALLAGSAVSGLAVIRRRRRK